MFLQLAADIVVASDHVRLLGMIISSDQSLQKCVSAVCAMCQVAKIRHSIDN